MAQSGLGDRDSMLGLDLGASTRWEFRRGGVLGACQVTPGLACLELGTYLG